MKNLPSILFGVFLGILLVLACGDGASPPADAAPDVPACNCPAAEPPIAARIVIVKNDVSIPAMDDALEGASCISLGRDAILLSGSCEVPGNDVGISLTRAGFDMAAANDWTCQWTNSNVTPVAAQVLAKCLVP